MRIVLVMLAALAIPASGADSGPYEIRTDEVKTGRNNVWVTRLVDKQAGITCYMLTVDKMMSCVKH